jgi:prepilin-type N-terminal cleavage/methylation domain-containing protein
MARHQRNQRQDRQKRDGAQGFTLVEVLVGILLISAFLGTAMQAIVSATAFKVKAQELSEATVWIQEDQELVRYQASRIAADVPRCSALSPSTGYAQALKEQLSSSIPTKYSALGKRPYTIDRVSTPVNAQPYHVLSLNYAVTRQGESAPIAQIHSEVIPDAFLSCP